MPSWKKVLISGSDAALNSLNITAALTASGIIYPSTDGTNGQVLTTNGSGQLSFSTISSGGTGSSVKLSQTVAATTWSFAHNLNEKFPAVTIYDSNDEVIIPQKIDAIDNNNMLVYFSSPTTGTAAAVVGGSTVSASYSEYAVTASHALSADNALTASYLTNPTVSGSINNVNYIDFNESAGVTVQSGQLAWNNTDGTLDLGLKGGNVTLQVGQETLYEVRNDTGVIIPNGTAVYASGVTAGSARIEASPFTADGSIREVRFLGLATENIGIGVNGYVTHFGYTRGLDTRGTATTAISVGDEDWSVGDILYAHPTAAGKLTNVKPKHEISVAIVIVRHQNTGVLFVRPASYGHMEDIHDVEFNSLSTGDLLVYDSGSDYWRNTKQLSGSYTITGSLEIQGAVKTTSSIQVGSNSDTASSTNVGSIRYRTSGNNSYVDMVMQTGASTYEWVNIVQNNW